MPTRRKSRKWRWILGIAAALLAIAAVSIRIAIVRAQPILRTRVIETLSARFKSRVELAELHVWVANGLHVDGKGLKVFGATDPNPWEAGVQPLLEIGEFRFQTALSNLFREPMHVDTIFVDGLTMNVPPKNDRREMTNFRHRSGKISIVVSHLNCTNTKLVINTVRTNKPPLEFDIGDLRMKDIGPGQPLQFEATLVNPKPIGDIQSTGLFGPLNEESPRDSSVNGHYSFTNADLGTLKGIGGILSSTGQYTGSLGRIEVNGETDTPDFRLAVSGHRVPLHTQFHAIVDGTDGDTYLDPVKARVLNSTFTANGKVVRMKNVHGHDIEMNVVLDRANIQDLLQLGVKTDPPLMSGTVQMKAALNLQPGEANITDRLKLAGTFHIPDGQFSNEKIQDKIDALSLRSRGKPKLAQDGLEMKVPSDLKGTFKMNQGVLSFSFLHFQIPGTHADVMGQYSLDGSTFDFHGTLKLDAKLSQMTTGWKSILLRPIDPFFHKNGAGTEVPFKIDGTKSEPHFGLDFHHKGQPTPKDPSETANRHQ
jgi:AsmA-like C-terminal region